MSKLYIFTMVNHINDRVYKDHYVFSLFEMSARIKLRPRITKKKCQFQEIKKHCSGYVFSLLVFLIARQLFQELVQIFLFFSRPH